ncbi:MAG: hypothetical protein LKI76_05020 [Megasphaera sp.]|jgi:retron-type reverse transcriptase|nr:hypothetical protein [Megasphaera sp.]
MGYRQSRSVQQAIRQIMSYAEQGYGFAVVIDLSKYFDTLNYDLLMNLMCKTIQDTRVILLVKKYLKSGVMDNGLFSQMKKGSSQGGPAFVVTSQYLFE